MIRIASNLELPLDAITETFSIIGRRGSGKTHTASVFVEGLLSASLQVAIIDPLDVWWGLGSSADGKRPGFSVVTCGGDRQHVPLLGTSGKLFADVLVDSGLSMIFSVRHLSKADQRRFVADFAERLYERKASSSTPLHLVVDEADAFVPQRIYPGSERAHGAIDTLVRRGRSSGVGTMLITQRPAVISKDVLTQTEVLVCHQTTGPQDRKALEAWIEANDADNRRKEFLGSLAGLAKGEAWVWSPSWLGIFKRVKVSKRATFDSSSTPKVGERRAAPGRMADVDLAELRQRIAATEKEVLESDPKALRRRIAELEAQLGSNVDVREAKLLAEQALESARRLGVMAEALGRIERLSQAVSLAATGIQDEVRGVASVAQRELNKALAVEREQSEGLTLPSPPPLPRELRGEQWELPRGETLVLTCIAQHSEGATRAMVTLVTGYKQSTRNAYIQRLQQRGHVKETQGRLLVTPEGRKVLPKDFRPLPTGDALLSKLLVELPVGEAEVLGAITQRAPRPITREEISAKTGYKQSTRNAYIQRLATRELVHTDGNRVFADDMLFDVAMRQA